MRHHGMAGRARGRGAATAVAGLVLLGSAATRMLVAHADAGPAQLGAYALTATAPGFEMTEDEPSAQAHPEGHGAAPETSTLLENGGVGYGLSTVAWPGATFANGGAVVALLFPGPAGQVVPIPDAITQAVRQAAPAANYPIKAEARSGSAPDAKFDAGPGATITAHADGNRVDGVGALNGADLPGVATYGSTRSSSSSTVEGAVGKAVATSTVHNVDFGGVVKIQSVISKAQAQTDGKGSSSSGGTAVSGMTIAGQSVSVDESGVKVGDQSIPANAAATQVVNQALDGMKMKVFMSQPQVQHDGASTSYNAGSLLFFWNPPGSQNAFTASLGGARVSVVSAPGFDVSLPAADVVPSAPLPGAPSAPAVGASPPPSPSSGVAALPAASPALAGRPSGPAATGSQRGTLDEVLAAARFPGFGVGWVLAALAGVGLLGLGSRRLVADVLDRPAGNCPLDGGRP